MDYFILTTKNGSYQCVNSIVRCKDGSGNDITTYVCSGYARSIPTAEILSITPSTPNCIQISALKG